MSHSFRPSRRQFLQTASTAGLVAALSGGKIHAQSGPAPAVSKKGSRARNLIFIVSDGMSMGALTLAELYARNIEGRGTAWAGVFNTPGVHTGLQDTASADSLVTDSAAGASSWGCGHRVNNGALNVTPDGVEREPILLKARRAGKATGVVTTTRVTYATPAGFVANVPKRSMEDDIAVQYLEREMDVYMGGGWRHFAINQREDGRDMEAEFTQAGYTVVRNRDALLRAGTDSRRLLGVFWDDHLPYTIDRANNPALAAQVPSLLEMTRAALARLSQEPNGFCMQIEGGRIDHAAHANDGAAIVHEQLDLDAVVAEVIAFQREHPDTLVIMTTDHGNSNPGLNGEGETVRALQALSSVKGSYDTILSGLKAESTLEEVLGRLRKFSGLPITEEQAEAVRDALAGQSKAVYRGLRTVRPVLGQVFANHTAVGWTGRWHTGDWVVLNAFGPGSESIPNLVLNYSLHGLCCEALGIG